MDDEKQPVERPIRPPRALPAPQISVPMAHDPIAGWEPEPIMGTEDFDLDEARQRQSEVLRIIGQNRGQ